MCGEQWKEYGTEPTYVDNDMSMQNKYSYTGIKFHETMEYWGNEKIRRVRSNYKISNLHNHLDNGLSTVPSTMYDNPIDEIDFRSSLHDQLDWLYDQACDNVPLEVEKKFSIDNLIPGLPLFVGTIDRLDGNLAHREVHGIDYKTGKVFTRNELSSNIQATIYSLAILREYGFLPLDFTFYFSKHKKVKIVEITPDFIDRGVERINNIWMHILNKDFQIPIKPNKWFCNHFCKSTTCRHKSKKWGNVGFEVFNPNSNLIV